ncbi:sensor histidine kinase [Stappia sp. GBMRC 2046]|uniref:C4-dicarboxylate transport sensor protein DctB n=1 Tax=Stappia sediminis TaxID=2692190 RepID=A0A7X3LUA8_9HYPH|nr:ATP-binding protein [Stappia sediminis]MXN65229.1 sensor histidine kinase [Stappia sediminis]
MYRLTRKRREIFSTALALIAAACLTVVVAFVTSRISERLFLDEIRTRADASLAVQAATLERQLDKFRLLPPLLAQRPDVRALISRGSRVDGERVASVVAAMSGAQEVVFLDMSGRTIASSAWPSQGPHSAGMQTFDTAFSEAMEGRLGRQLLRGDALRAGSYVFASAVRSGGETVGAVAVRVDLASVEQAWALSKDPLVALDDGGVVVVTNRPSWRGRRMVETTRGVEYADATSGSPSSIFLDARLRSGFDIVQLDDGAIRLDALRLTKPLTVLGWEVSTLANTQIARSQTSKAWIIAALVCILLAGTGWAALERRKATIRKMRDDRAAALRLERRVRERTQDLSEANKLLAREVEEREAAEAELRLAQAELVQAAKLATLGRMSAALSHEFNQPLAAIRSNAENAQLLLERKMQDKAAGNLEKIIAMVERMAEISRTLKGFTRRAGTELKPVRLITVIDEALMLLSPRIKRSDVEIIVDKDAGDPVVLGGRVRLEQVVLNLISNALDAVGGRTSAKVGISLKVEGGFALIEVADNGPGVSEELRSQVFDPFFTTKDVGEGLGLGLSIAYKIVHDFSGNLSVTTSQDGGALFTVRLPLEGESRAAAE